MCRCHQAV